MRRLCFIAALLLPYFLQAQYNWSAMEKRSPETFAFKITSAEAEKFIRKDTIPVDRFLQQQPDYILSTVLMNTDDLPAGFYLCINTDDNMLHAFISCVTKIVAYSVNNQNRVQLAVRDSSGNHLQASVWVNGKKAHYNKDAKTFTVKSKTPEDAFIKIYTETDTCFMELYGNEELRETVREQRWKNIKSSKTWKEITWAPLKIAGLFDGRKNYYYKNKYAGSTGFMVFNQPKYKLTDTVKLKAYIISKHKRPYKKPADVFLEYYFNGQKKQQLTSLHPSSPGSFIYSFPLSDTLPNDRNMIIVFRNRDGQQLLKSSFSTEDYLLDEVTNYSIKANAEDYFTGDTIKITASAKDANGLPVMDGKATLIITPVQLLKQFSDSVYVSDTLYMETKELAADAETVFSVPAAIVPKVNISLEAKVVFTNSSNEIHNKSEVITYSAESKMIHLHQSNGYMHAEYRVNGKSILADGFVCHSYDKKKKKAITYPADIKIDPMEMDYFFYALQNNILADSAEMDVEDKYDVSFSRLSINDTLGFVLNNPYEIPVFYSVLFGNTIVASGSSDEAKIVWKKQENNVHKIYRVAWQYYWGWQEQRREDKIAVLAKMLNIETNSLKNVFPGQKDTITVKITDYKQKPADKVNLTAVSYNNQFKNINIKEPPYLMKYKWAKFVKRDSYDYDDAGNIEKYPLGKHKDWLYKLKADTMLNYKTLFPENGFRDIAARIDSYIPQLSVHVAENGNRREIILLYVNNQLVYYNGVTDKMPYAFSSIEGYTKIAVRLKDYLFEMDSIYLQPFYKHDLFIDISKLPEHSKLIKLPEYFSADERSLLENRLWQLNGFGKNDEGYVWQKDYVTAINGSFSRIAGPFKPFDSLHFYSPGDFDIHFIFEPGYQYRLSDKIERLEKKKIFPDFIKQISLTENKDVQWTPGDTLIVPPAIEYNKSRGEIYLFITDNQQYKASQNNYTEFGDIIMKIKCDSAIKYIVMFPPQEEENYSITESNTTAFSRLLPGTCTILFVTKYGSACEKQVIIHAGKTLYMNFSEWQFIKQNERLQKILDSKNRFTVTKEKVIAPVGETYQYDSIIPYRFRGSGTITGQVIDAKGKLPVGGATVIIRGVKTGTSTSASGNFAFKNIKAGTYILEISAIGYEQLEVKTIATENNSSSVTVALNPMVQYLQEVVVTGIGVSKKRELTGSLITIKADNLFSRDSLVLQGKSAGLSVTDGSPGNNIKIMLRGTRSFSGANKLAYMIDGIAYDSIPSNITEDMIDKIDLLQGAEAVNAYGAIAADGIYIITTKTKITRSQFKDYALWQPEIFTDKNGVAKIAITYPDNITAWQTNIIAIDKKNRIGKKQFNVTAYKPLLAQLSSPQFLISGDTSFFTAKASNYTKENYTAQSSFSIRNTVTQTSTITIPANESAVQYFQTIAANTDSLNSSFSIATTTGYKDAEERSIPVYPQGLEISEGFFKVMNTDTAITYADNKPGALHLYAQSKTLDMMLADIDRLQKYPYTCIEQTSSKLRGLLMEKQIREALSQKFTQQKTVNMLIQKILAAQLYDGSWPWWQNGKTNLHITNYALQALLPLQEDILAYSAIRNGLLYLQNQLPSLNKNELIETLGTLSMAHHALMYEPWLAKINFDSLNVHAQWQYVSILQNLQMPYDSLLNKLLSKKIETATGGLHFGEENYSWYSNEAATTVIAYNVLKQSSAYKNILPSIYQYFLERKQNGYFTNTVETASILSSILPDVLADNKNFNSPATLQIQGDTSCTISSFPAQLQLSSSIHNLRIQKSNGGLVYCTLYKNYFQPQPKKVDSLFDITTHFEKNNSTIAKLTAGETVNFIIELTAKKDAEYVMIEAPIPAGCTYNQKNIYFAGATAEYFKNKIVLFAASLSKGTHTFSIPLQPRYTGRYIINPAKASLMYFPVLYGCNQTGDVEINNKK